jgi:hypothetical protein
MEGDLLSNLSGTAVAPKSPSVGPELRVGPGCCRGPLSSALVDRDASPVLSRASENMPPTPPKLPSASASSCQVPSLFPKQHQQSQPEPSTGKWPRQFCFTGQISTVDASMIR